MPCAFSSQIAVCLLLADCRELEFAVCLVFAVCRVLCYAVCHTSQVGSRSAARRAQVVDAWHVCRVQAHGIGHMVSLPCASTRQRPSFFTLLSAFTGIPAHKIQYQYICNKANSSGITTTYLHHKTNKYTIYHKFSIIDHKYMHNRSQ
jgi:hypothetical protein